MEVLWVQEQDGLIVGADLWFAVTQHTSALTDQLVTGSDYVFDFITKMMNPARWVIL